jgi:transposase-like protein
MAERKRMTAEQVVGYLLEGEGLDFLRESLSWVVEQLMEAGVAVGWRCPRRAGARGAADASKRLSARPWQTRAGELELAIPKLRRGSYG